MNFEGFAAAVVLLCVSLVVRVLPALPRLRVRAGAERILVVLPPIVMVNLAVYCVVSEISQSPVPAAAGVATVLGVLALTRRVPVIAAVSAAVVVYALVAQLTR